MINKIEKVKMTPEEKALEEHEGGNMSLWPVPDNEENREYWKKVWRLGYNAGLEKAIVEIESLKRKYYEMDN